MSAVIPTYKRDRSDHELPLVEEKRRRFNLYFSLGKLRGEGSFAQVFDVTHIRGKNSIGLGSIDPKLVIKISDMAPDAIKETLHEAKVLKDLQNSPYFTKYYASGLLQFEGYERSYLLEEACTNSLGNIIRRANIVAGSILRNNEFLSFFNVICMSMHLCHGLNQMHKKGFVHRDIKPDNLLLGLHNLKVADLGASRSVGDRSGGSDVVTRWYRAPEIFLETSDYTPAIDIWSAGCTFLESITCSSPFQIPDEYRLKDPFIVFSRVLGPYPISLVPSGKTEYFQSIEPTAVTHPIAAMVDACTNDLRFGTKICTLEELTLIKGQYADLISKMLVYNPAERITAEAALEHPVFKTLMDWFG